MHSLIRKSAENNSANGGPNAALECTFHGELNVALEGVLWVYFKEPLKMH